MGRQLLPLTFLCLAVLQICSSVGQVGHKDSGDGNQGELQYRGPLYDGGGNWNGGSGLRRRNQSAAGILHSVRQRMVELRRRRQRAKSHAAEGYRKREDTSEQSPQLEETGFHPALSSPAQVEQFCRTTSTQCTLSARSSVSALRARQGGGQHSSHIQTEQHTDGGSQDRVGRGESLRKKIADIVQKLRRDLPASPTSRRLLAKSGRSVDSKRFVTISFPQSFYKLYGGLDGIERASEDLLSSVEGRICQRSAMLCSGSAQKRENSMQMVANQDSSSPQEVNEESAHIRKARADAKSGHSKLLRDTTTIDGSFIPEGSVVTTNPDGSFFYTYTYDDSPKSSQSSSGIASLPSESYTSTTSHGSGSGSGSSADHLYDVIGSGSGMGFGEHVEHYSDSGATESYTHGSSKGIQDGSFHDVIDSYNHDSGAGSGSGSGTHHQYIHDDAFSRDHDVHYLDHGAPDITYNAHDVSGSGSGGGEHYELSGGLPDSISSQHGYGSGSGDAGAQTYVSGAREEHHAAGGGPDSVYSGHRGDWSGSGVHTDFSDYNHSADGKFANTGHYATASGEGSGAVSNVHTSWVDEGVVHGFEHGVAHVDGGEGAGLGAHVHEVVVRGEGVNINAVHDGVMPYPDNAGTGLPDFHVTGDTYAGAGINFGTASNQGSEQEPGAGEPSVGGRHDVRSTDKGFEDVDAEFIQSQNLEELLKGPKWRQDWKKFVSNYHPGTWGFPGFHPGLETPPKLPIQNEDGTWQPDITTGVGPKECIWMYAGPEVGLGAVNGTNAAVVDAAEKMAPVGSDQIKKFWTLHPSTVRDLLWDEDALDPDSEVQYVIIPALHDFPAIPHTTKIDIREWVHYGHTFILLGGSVNIYLMNEIFGLRLEPQWQPGPYHWNERYAIGTPFQDLPRKVFGGGGNTIAGLTGVVTASMPPGGMSFYDANGSSQVLCIRFGRGRVCWINQEFIEPMSAYHWSQWTKILRASINGGSCKKPQCQIDHPPPHDPWYCPANE